MKKDTFEATIKGETLMTAILAASALVSECRVTLGKDGLQILAVDKGNVSLVEVQVASGAFTSYRGDKGTIGLDLENLKKALGLMGKDDEVAMVAAGGSLKLTFGEVKYATRLLDPETVRKDPTAPSISPPTQFTVPGRDLAATLKTLGAFADITRLVADPAKGTCYAEGIGNLDQVRLNLAPTKISGKAASCWYSLDYLKDMAQTLGKATEVDVALGERTPIMFTCEIAGCRIRYILAPRIEDIEPEAIL
jgi:DNA polymerase III sliding clamp (beta) subunit (PCNA family)